MAEFQVSVVQNGRSTDLLVAGEVGLEVADRLAAAGSEAARNSDRPRIVLDLGKVTFLDSTGIGALVTIRTEALGAGKEVRVRNVPARVERLFAITGLTDAFPLDDAPN